MKRIFYHSHHNILLLAGVLLILCSNPVIAEQFDSERVAFRVETVVTPLVHPWAVAFLPSGDMLITERNGRLLLAFANGGSPVTIDGLPIIEEYGQGGLLDVILDPAFEENDIIYLSYAGKENNKYGTEVLRAYLDIANRRLYDLEVIFKLARKSDKPYHFGSRLLFVNDDTLLVTLGDRGEQDRAQDPLDHAGSLIRIHSDGSLVQSNPYINGNFLPEIYTVGNRNMQGIAMHPLSGAIYTHEHGPQGGDELNRMLAGYNYGWPVITYGVNYGTGTSIGEGQRKEGMKQPLHYWIPSIAPSGMTFYTGNEFPEWQGNLFIGSLKFGQLVRLEMKADVVMHEERMLNNRLGRIRDVRQGPDGTLYLLTDEKRGQLLRLVRAE